MSKLFKVFSILSIVLFSALSPLSISPARAAGPCNLTIEPNYVSPEAKGGQIFQLSVPDNSCFDAQKIKNQDYTFVLYNKKIELKASGGNVVPTFLEAPISEKDFTTQYTTLKVSFNLTKSWWQGGGPADFNMPKEGGTLQAVVCIRGKIITDTCPNNIVARGSITVGTPATTPGLEKPDDMPIIDKGAQDTCAFRLNSQITINRITNIQGNPPDTYKWWWVHKGDLNDLTLNNFNDTIAGTTIDTNDIKSSGSYLLCIDKEKDATGKPYKTSRVRTDINCLDVVFTAYDPEKISCSEVSGGKCIKTKNNQCTSAGGPVVPGCNDVEVTDPKDSTKTIPNPNPGIPTAIGCIRTNPVALTKDFLKFALGISGGLAFLLMIFGAFQMLTSAGNPETLNAGKDRLTSAVIGLLLIIFSVLLLQIIGVDILGLGQQFGLK